MEPDALDDAADAEHAEATAVAGELVDDAGDAAPGGEGAAGEDLETRALVYLLLRQGFDILAPAWAVTDSECNALTDAYDPLLRKYFPDLGRFGPEVGAVLVTAAVLAPRIGQPRTVAEPAPADDDTTDAPA